VQFVEADGPAAGAIERSLEVLGAAAGRVVHGDAFAFLAARAPQPFDVVFLDPPYGERRLEQACAKLESGGWLAPGAWIYLEDAANSGAPELPAGWTLLRSKKAGDVGYHLARRQAAS